MALIIVEVDDACALAGDLFRRAFGQGIPGFPRHFVALYREPAAALRVVCYIHYTPWGSEGWLCGGLCVDQDAYTRAEPEEAEKWKRTGGLGEMMLRHTFARLTDRAAIFGYCGDARQWQHDLNAGFLPAGPRHLLVKWNRPLPVTEQAVLVARAAALGPF